MKYVLYYLNSLTYSVFVCFQVYLYEILQIYLFIGPNKIRIEELAGEFVVFSASTGVGTVRQRAVER